MGDSSGKLENEQKLNKKSSLCKLDKCFISFAKQ